MPNRYKCSNGDLVPETYIKRKLSEAYKTKYAGRDYHSCFECGQPAQGSAHIIPKARLKQIGKTELIWDWEVFVEACHTCNSKIENISSPEFKLLNGYEYYLEIFRKYDFTRYLKAI